MFHIYAFYSCECKYVSAEEGEDVTEAEENNKRRGGKEDGVKKKGKVTMTREEGTGNGPVTKLVYTFYWGKTRWHGQLAPPPPP